MFDRINLTEVIRTVGMVTTGSSLYFLGTLYDIRAAAFGALTAVCSYFAGSTFHNR